MLRRLTLTLLLVFATIPAIAAVETAPSLTPIDHQIAHTRVDVAGEISLPAIALFEPETRLTLFPSKRKLASGSLTSVAGTNYLEPRELSAKSWQGHDYMHARYYSPVMGRFLSIDPVMDVEKAQKEPQRWNRYSYVINNPLKYTDPDGRETTVFVVQNAGLLDDWRGSFGHSAIYVTSGNDARGISWGTPVSLDRGPTAFIDAYTSAGRGVQAFVLNTTPEQDKAMLQFIKSTGGSGDVPQANSILRFATQNCTTAVCNTLQAGGVIKPGQDPNGVRSLLVRPNELAKALSTGGELAPKVKNEINYPPKKKEEEDEARRRNNH